MIYSQKPEMEWAVHVCEMVGDKIAAQKGFPVAHYNPFDYHNVEGRRTLYLQFIEVDETDTNEIFKFVSKYGFLGFKHDTEKVSLEPYKEERKKYSDHLASLRRTPESDGFIKELVTAISWRDVELIEDIRQEILEMRTIVNIVHEIQSGTEISLGPVFDLYSRAIPFDSTSIEEIQHEFDDQALRFFAKSAVELRIDTKLKGVHPHLGSNKDGNRFSGTWRVPTLLSAMYLMLYTDIVGSKMFRKCRNVTCNMYFPIYGNDARKVYCSNNCARLQAQREYRQRKKRDEI